MKYRILLIVLIACIGIFTQLQQRKTHAQRLSYTKQAFEHYRLFVCKHQGVCQPQQALSHLQQSWPYIYHTGYTLLENEQ